MKKHLAIIGGGPSAFLLAAHLDPEKFDVTIYEKNKTAGRKFLVAGKGGFNLTHSENIEQLIERYTPTSFLSNALRVFSNEDFQTWLVSIDIPTFIGSSKRIYPKEGIKPIEVLTAILNNLKKRGVTINYEHTFSGWDESNRAIINEKLIQADYTVFCLGGSSWKVTGSDGSWIDTFAKKGITTNEFKASNCGFKIDWNPEYISKYEGTPLKNIAVSCNDFTQKGEAVITIFGLEGNAIYGLSPQIREQLQINNKAEIFIDFKPSFTLEKLHSKIKTSNQKTTSQLLKKELKLTSAQIDLIREKLSKEAYLNPGALANAIKKFPVEIVNTAPIEEAISTVGGIDLKSVSENFELKKLPNQFCIGEMLDWDAPTGGYLLQGCASSGVALAKYLNKQIVLS